MVVVIGFSLKGSEGLQSVDSSWPGDSDQQVLLSAKAIEDSARALADLGPGQAWFDTSCPRLIELLKLLEGCDPRPRYLTSSSVRYFVGGHRLESLSIIESLLSLRFLREPIEIGEDRG